MNERQREQRARELDADLESKKAIAETLLYFLHRAESTGDKAEASRVRWYLSEQVGMMEKDIVEFKNLYRHS